MNTALAQLILAVHVAVIGFNLAGLVAVPIGARRGWGWVRVRWWRLLHLASLAVVAVQAVFGQACFLTVLQAGLEGGSRTPLIQRWINALIYWPLPIWVFSAAYVAIFVYAAALWWWVPPSPRPSSGRR
jgi:Protein of Unknown function (DUF2784)